MLLDHRATQSSCSGRLRSILLDYTLAGVGGKAPAGLRRSSWHAIAHAGQALSASQRTLLPTVDWRGILDAARPGSMGLHTLQRTGRAVGAVAVDNGGKAAYGSVCVRKGDRSQRGSCSICGHKMDTRQNLCVHSQYSAVEKVDQALRLVVALLIGEVLWSPSQSPWQSARM